MNLGGQYYLIYSTKGSRRSQIHNTDLRHYLEKNALRFSKIPVSLNLEKHSMFCRELLSETCLCDLSETLEKGDEQDLDHFDFIFKLTAVTV